MKRKKMAAILAVCLSVSMAVPTQAAGWADFTSWISSSWSSRKNSSKNTKSKTSSSSSGTMTVVEDESTVSDGTELRASTYLLSAYSEDDGTNTGEVVVNGTTLKYFPVTLYDYDDNYNNALHQQEVDTALAAGGISNLTQWNGIYFGGNDLGANVKGTDSYTYSTGAASYSSTTVTASISYGDNSYTLSNPTNYYYKDGENYYQVTSAICTRSGYYTNYSYSWTISYNNTTATATTQSITLYTANNTATTSALSYAAYNKWTGESGSGNRTYSGMVQSNLTNDNKIVFNYPEAGIFTSDNSNKEVYTNVQMPFVYDSSDQTYTFDASKHGFYFHDDDTQGTSSTPKSGDKLYYNATPQSQEFRGQDGRNKGWYPFNDTTSVQTASADYFFGMNATIPFSMTKNGKLENGNPITFDFSGDDDVWVFIDGVLVLDMGGSRNCLDGSINFAENTFTITKTSGNGGGDLGDAGTASGSNLSGQLFNTVNSDGTTTKGVLNTTLESFALTDEHNLTVYYLERGAGSSNCKIKFNLPVNDSVSVQKLVSDKDSNGEALAAETVKANNNQDFTFILYKNDEALVNTSYLLYDENGQYVETRSTSDTGEFKLKNNQRAKFVGTINSTDGSTYYVKENSETGWENASYTLAQTTIVGGGYTQTDSSVANQSMTVTAKGSAEAEDNISFVCTNTMTHVEDPTIRATDDEIVIDYGLPVMIDVLSNDSPISAKDLTIEEVSEAQYGTATVENGKIKYQLTKQLTGVEKLTYTVTGTSTKTGAADPTATANVYIIPATSMYYEENFENADGTTMITYRGSWEKVGTAQTDCQELGVVGTSDDSPYGSDLAYLNDSGDSNGSSMHVDTTNGAASFSYSFTGTGTSIFARTTQNSGYMRVVIEGKGTYYRDTIYMDKDENGNLKPNTLYNIPVFTWNAADYGTYTVTVTIAKAKNTQGTVIFGNEFWLDGIRVQKPLNSNDENVKKAQSAYSSDGEANMSVVTLRTKILSDVTTLGKVGDKEETLIGSSDSTFVVFTDTDGQIIKAADYQSKGPKEEVYLNNGQKITFSLKNWDPNSNRMYLGIKAPKGTGTVFINNNEKELQNAADCYYEISKYANVSEVDGVKVATFEIQAGENCLVSVTNIKVTGNTEFAIVDKEEYTGDAQALSADDNQFTDSEEETAEAAGEAETTAEDELVVEETSEGETNIDISVEGEENNSESGSDEMFEDSSAATDGSADASKSGNSTAEAPENTGVDVLEDFQSE